MDLYLIALFAHIVGALLLFSLVGIETIGLLRLRSATSVEAARVTLGFFGVLRPGHPLVFLLIVVPGLWMAADRWRTEAWTMVALVAMLVLAGIGMVVTGAAMRRVGPRIGGAQGAWTPELTAVVRDPMLARSLALRIGIGVGIVGVMVFKPDMAGSLAWVVGGGIVGLLASLLL